jgi:diguanylate cyclase (GGDEF)-like protein
MVLCYVPLMMVIVLVAMWTLVSLNRVNEIHDGIIRGDIVLLGLADDLMDTIMAQESYGRRYVILRDEKMLELFRERSSEFNRLVTRLEFLPEQERIPTGRLVTLHNEFNVLYRQGLNALDKSSKGLDKVHDGLIKEKFNEMRSLIHSMVTAAKRHQSARMVEARAISSKAFSVTALLSSLGVLLGFGVAFLVTRNILRSIRELEGAAKEISEGNFDHVAGLKSRDELGELAGAFTEMGKRLAHLEDIHLDANPLTRLPGGIAIEEVLRTRLDAGKSVSFCLVDLDNFKVFNDRYGYARGNEVIKMTADVIEAAVALHGSEDDFVGHIGGDDFVLITSPRRQTALCETILREFDVRIAKFYAPEDRERGYIVGITRQGKTVEVPVMTVSIAVVTNQTSIPMSHIRVGEIAAELKERAKLLPGSVIVKDRRRSAGHMGVATYA